MISESHRFIFIHIEKTAGTSVSAVLLPLSDDHEVRVAGTGVTIDSFGIEGPVTRTKHMPLREYLVLGEGRFDDYFVLTSLRHPLDRMLSRYFSPGAWIRGRVPGGLRAAKHAPSPTAQKLLTRELEPVWDRRRFVELVSRRPSQSDILRLPDGSVRKPDWALDLADPDASLRELSRMLGVDDLGPLPKKNIGKTPHLVRELRQREDLAQFVRAAHREDYERFGYPLFPPGIDR